MKITNYNENKTIRELMLEFYGENCTEEGILKNTNCYGRYVQREILIVTAIGAFILSLLLLYKYIDLKTLSGRFIRFFALVCFVTLILLGIKYVYKNDCQKLEEKWGKIFEEDSKKSIKPKQKRSYYIKMIKTIKLKELDEEFIDNKFNSDQMGLIIQINESEISSINKKIERNSNRSIYLFFAGMLLEEAMEVLKIMFANDIVHLAILNFTIIMFFLLMALGLRLIYKDEIEFWINHKNKTDIFVREQINKHLSEKRIKLL